MPTPARIEQPLNQTDRLAARIFCCVVQTRSGLLGIWSRRREEISRAGAWFGDRWGGAIDPAEEASKIVEEGGEEQPRAVLMEAWLLSRRLRSCNKRRCLEGAASSRGRVEDLARKNARTA